MKRAREAGGKNDTGAPSRLLSPATVELPVTNDLLANATVPTTVVPTPVLPAGELPPTEPGLSSRAQSPALPTYPASSEVFGTCELIRAVTGSLNGPTLCNAALTCRQMEKATVDLRSHARALAGLRAEKIYFMSADSLERHWKTLFSLLPLRCEDMQMRTDTEQKNIVLTLNRSKNFVDFLEQLVERTVASLANAEHIDASREVSLANAQWHAVAAQMMQCLTAYRAFDNARICFNLTVTVTRFCTPGEEAKWLFFDKLSASTLATVLGWFEWTVAKKSNKDLDDWKFLWQDWRAPLECPEKMSASQWQLMRLQAIVDTMYLADEKHTAEYELDDTLLTNFFTDSFGHVHEGALNAAMLRNYLSRLIARHSIPKKIPDTHFFMILQYCERLFSDDKPAILYLLRTLMAVHHGLARRNGLRALVSKASLAALPAMQTRADIVTGQLKLMLRNPSQLRNGLELIRELPLDLQFSVWNAIDHKLMMSTETQGCEAVNQLIFSQFGRFTETQQSTLFHLVADMLVSETSVRDQGIPFSNLRKRLDSTATFAPDNRLLVIRNLCSAIVHLKRHSLNALYDQLSAAIAGLPDGALQVQGFSAMTQAMAERLRRQRHDELEQFCGFVKGMPVATLPDGSAALNVLRALDDSQAH